MQRADAAATLPPAFHAAVEHCATPLSRHVLWVRIHQQQMFLFQEDPRNGTETSRYQPQRNFLISTSRFGIGQKAGSNCTPLGLHRIAEKIGGRWPAGTVFQAREPIGFTWKGMPDAKITTRILWLEGLEPGYNRGGDVDSHDRYIYIHGTGDNSTIGRPASCGCIHVADADLVPLFELLPSGTLVWIEE
jgi:L,D-transpeptidase YbiS